MTKNHTAASMLAAMLSLFTPQSVAAADPSPEMQALIKSAQAERQVEVILSGQMPQKLRALMPDFQEKYGIRVNFQTGGGPAHAQRILAERRVGRYTIDAWLGGDGTALTQLIPNGALAPIPELLIDPDVTDASKWYKGRHYYTDPDQRYVFAFGAQPLHVVSFNTKLVNPNEIRSFADLLDPKWKGKMVSWSPAARGAGASSLAMFLHPNIGEEWFKRWAREMDVTIVEDARQGAEWVALGRYHLGIFGISTQAETMRSEGFPIQGHLPHAMAEGEILTASAANIMVLDRAPHPKATQLFVNWLLTRDVQQKLITIARQSDSLRTDVDSSVVDAAHRRNPDADYFVSFVHPDYQYAQTELFKRLGQIMQEAGFR
jgi:iron(III) transport system substrate-binding protein